MPAQHQQYDESYENSYGLFLVAGLSGSRVLGQSGAARYPRSVAQMPDQYKPDLLTSNALSYEPGTIWKPTLTRFQALIGITKSLVGQFLLGQLCTNRLVDVTSVQQEW